MSIQLEDFPLEVLIIIFGKLDINSLLRLRCVNKKFRDFIVPNVRIKCLSLRNRLNSNDREFVSKRFFHTNEALEDFNCFATANCDFFKRKLMKLIFSKLQKLFIIGQNSRDHQVFNINEIINPIKTLEQLEIHDIKISKGRVIQLPNLKNLCIKNLCINSYNHLKLDLPNLIVFRTNMKLEIFEFNYYDKIEYLYLDKIYFTSYAQSSLFKNLKYFFTIEFINTEIFMHFLPNFTKFKELHFYKIKKQDLQNLLNNISMEIKIYLRGIKINKFENIDKYYNDDNELKNYYDFVKLTVNNETYKIMPYYHEINYTDLIKIYSGKLLNNFTNKFFNIFKLVVDEIDEKLDQTLFINFIREIRALNNLKINNDSFNDNFYSNLNEYCPYLTKLTLKSIENLNSKFLLDIKYLRKIAIRSEFSFDSLINNFINLEKRFPIIRIGNKKIIVRKLNYHFEVEFNHSKQTSLERNTRTAIFTNQKTMINLFKNLYEIKLNQNLNKNKI